MKIIKYLIVCAIIFSCDSDTKKNTQPPNVVIIFTDDQGYGDLGSFGSMDIKTPNLPEFKIKNPVREVVIREKRKKEKKESTKKYLDQLFDKKGDFFKKYFEEK